MIYKGKSIGAGDILIDQHGAPHIIDNFSPATGQVYAKGGQRLDGMAWPVDRATALVRIWRQTHSDYRGHIDGKRSIMLAASLGGGLVKLSDMTDEQIKHYVREYHV